MKIVPTEYRREDGISMHRREDDTWVVRCVKGPTWFYNPARSEWQVSTTMTGKDIDALGMTFGRAMVLLETVEKV